MREIPRFLTRLFRRTAVPAMAAGVLFAGGCAKEGRSGDAATTGASDAPDEEPDQTAAVEPAQPTPPPAPPPKPQSPQRPKDSWTIFRAAFDEKADATMDSRWTGGNRLEVTTENIQRVTVDLHKLPEDAPQRGPWVLQIDGQGIQITGFRGKVIELVRSANGEWTVDKDAMPQRR